MNLSLIRLVFLVFIVLATLISIKYPKSKKPLILWSLIGFLWLVPSGIAYLLGALACGMSDLHGGCNPLKGVVENNVTSYLFYLPVLIPITFGKLAGDIIILLGNTLEFFISKKLVGLILLPLLLIILIIELTLYVLFPILICCIVGYSIQRISIQIRDEE